jgi:flagellar hook-associated protein 2
MASPITSSSMIDVQGIVTNLMRVESAPLTALKKDATAITTKISAYGKVSSAIATFRDATNNLAQLGTWKAVSAVSSNPSAVTVTASSSAAVSQNSIEVQQLARAQNLASGSYAASTATVGGGTLEIQLGTQPAGATSFTAGSAAAISVTIAAGATLADVRDSINAAGAGVRASIVKDGDGVRLFVGSTTTGANQAFKMTATDSDGNSNDATGLSALAFDPTKTAGAGSNMTMVQRALDANYTIDGLALTSHTNTVTSALDGVDLTFNQVTTAAVQINVKSDTDTLKASTQKFVDAYNALNKILSDGTRYDESTKTAGPLQADRSAVTVLQQIRSIVTDTVTGGTLTRLADAGMSLQRDGSITLNANTFASAASTPSNLQALFAATGGGTGSTTQGLMLRFRTLADGITGTNGALTAASDNWAARKKNNQTRQDSMQVRLDARQAALLKQYSALDAKLAAAQQSGSQLSSALAGLPK